MEDYMAAFLQTSSLREGYKANSIWKKNVIGLVEKYLKQYIRISATDLISNSLTEPAAYV
jgi:hypothetical protein